MEGTFTFHNIPFHVETFKNNKGLVTRTPESETIEYKWFGKLMHYGDKSKIYQPNEIKETIIAFLNTKGGCLYMGVHDHNGFLSGGDYTLLDKTRLGLFLKNFATNLKIAGLGLIDYAFYSIPKVFQLPCEDSNAERCLAVIIVHKAPYPIIQDDVIIIREMNTNTKLTIANWKLRQRIQNSINNTIINSSTLQKNYAQVASLNLR